MERAGLDRRWGGALILLVALVAALVGAARTKTLAGTPRLAPLIGAPAVGDCLVRPIELSVDVHPTLYRDPVLRPCTGSRYGEVTMVLPGIEPSITRDIGYGEGDPFQTLCATAADRYLGLPTAPDGTSGQVDGVWFPMVLSTSLPTAPATSWRENPPWVACVLTSTGLNGRAESYPRSARNGLSTGTLPGVFAGCPAANTLGGSDCFRPHPVETLGHSGPLDAPPTRTELEQTCRRLAIAMTGLPDPAADPRVDLAVVASSSGYSGSDGREAVSFSCQLVATRGHELTGPLMGLGAAPLPVR